MTEQTAKQRRPFHETVADAILQASAPGEVTLLARMIKTTKIPKGHDEIIAAWRYRQDNWGLVVFPHGVVEDLLEQKQEAEEKEKEKKAKEQVEVTSS